MRSIILGAMVFFGLGRAVMADMGHGEALDAVRAGEILPLLPIIENAEQAYEGRVVEVELSGGDDGGSGLFYEIKILTTDGRLLELLVDATTGEAVGLGGRGVGLE